MNTNARIVSWQERGSPYDGYPYSATTPHYLWDGGTSIADRVGNFKYCAACAPVVENEKRKIHQENFKRKRRGGG